MNFNTEVTEMLCKLRGRFREPRRARRISIRMQRGAGLACLVASSLHQANEHAITLVQNAASSTEELLARAYPFRIPEVPIIYHVQPWGAITK
jgi:hypothetical protein